MNFYKLIFEFGEENVSNKSKINELATKDPKYQAVFVDMAVSDLAKIVHSIIQHVIMMTGSEILRCRHCSDRACYQQS
jgi:hypothetical protein